MSTANETSLNGLQLLMEANEISSERIFRDLLIILLKKTILNIRRF